MSTQYPEQLNNLIDLFCSLPGVGKRTAVRMAFTVLKWPAEKQKALGEILCNLDENIAFCPECGNIAPRESKCLYCLNPSRHRDMICVVEDFSQIGSIESSGFFKGLYHVLGGRLAPLEGKNAEDLNLDSLMKRVAENGVSEVILALAQDVEGAATAIYIADLLKDMNVKITRLARGLPAGSDLSYADSATVAAALNGRTDI